jgi:excisionase family DNA binding protein
MKLLSTTEAAARLSLSPSRVRRYCEQGRLPATKIGGSWVIREADLGKLERLPQGWRKGRPRKHP